MFQSITSEERLKNQINYYVERIIFLKGKVKITKLDYVRTNYLKSIKWCQRRIEQLTNELVEVK